MKYETELVAAIEAVTLAAGLTRRVQEALSPGTLRKDDRSPVTVADYGSQALVCSTLEAVFPADPIIAEETADALRDPQYSEVRDRVVGYVKESIPEATTKGVLDWIDRGTEADGSARFWTLDPIDGTKGFLRGDQFAVALALIIDGEPAVAALACPALPARDGSRGIVMWAVRGHGTWEQPLLGTGRAHAGGVRVSNTRDWSRARFSESYESGHSSHGDAARVATALGITSRPLRLDSQAKYAVVARGDADIYMRLPTKSRYVERIWDHAAGSLVVHEAGGQVTDVRGKALDFGLGRMLSGNLGVAVTNGHLHEDLISALRSEGIGVPGS